MSKWIVMPKDGDGFDILDNLKLVATLSGGEVEDYHNALLIAAAPELHTACIIVWESLIFPNKHSISEIKKALEVAIVKSQLLK